MRVIHKSMAIIILALSIFLLSCSIGRIATETESGIRAGEFFGLKIISSVSLKLGNDFELGSIACSEYIQFRRGSFEGALGVPTPNISHLGPRGPIFNLEQEMYIGDRINNQIFIIDRNTLEVSHISLPAELLVSGASNWRDSSWFDFVIFNDDFYLLLNNKLVVLNESGEIIDQIDVDQSDLFATPFVERLMTDTEERIFILGLNSRYVFEVGSLELYQLDLPQSSPILGDASFRIGNDGLVYTLVYLENDNLVLQNWGNPNNSESWPPDRPVFEIDLTARIEEDLFSLEGIPIPRLIGADTNGKVFVHLRWRSGETVIMQINPEGLSSNFYWIPSIVDGSHFVIGPDGFIYNGLYSMDTIYQCSLPPQ